MLSWNVQSSGRNRVDKLWGWGFGGGVSSSVNVCVCVCICMYVYIYIYICTCVCIFIYIYMSVEFGHNTQIRQLNRGSEQQMVVASQNSEPSYLSFLALSLGSDCMINHGYQWFLVVNECKKWLTTMIWISIIWWSGWSCSELWNAWGASWSRELSLPTTW